LSQCHFVHHRSHVLTRAINWAYAVWGRRLTAWATARIMYVCTEPERSLPCTQNITTSPYIVPHEPVHNVTVWPKLSTRTVAFRFPE
jgi:hypothetical protein